MLNSNKILILAPHTDDGELGCGAAISKYTSIGKEVFYVAFSSCAQSLPKGLPTDLLIKECKAATEILGIAKTYFFDFEVRRFTENRQPILETLVKIAKEINPQTVFLPAKNDVHQDHQVIYWEGMRAFKNCNVLGYELPWNNTNFSPNYFEVVGEKDLSAKQNALKEYASQSHRNYMSADFIRSLATVRGVQANAPFAEGFEIYRLVS